MTITEALHTFYLKNNLSLDGGENDDYFHLKFKLFSLKLPNFEFRKKIVYLHDIQHILFDQDISWKGESFIAGYEISSGMWKKIPIGFISIWAMGFSLFNYPKEVLKGYKKGLLYDGVLDMKISKEELLRLNVEEINNMLLKEKPQQFNLFTYIFWCFVSSVTFLFPFLLLLILSIYLW